MYSKRRKEKTHEEHYSFFFLSSDDYVTGDKRTSIEKILLTYCREERRRTLHVAINRVPFLHQNKSTRLGR